HCWGPASRDAAASRARSLCGKIRAYERLWRSVKYEEVYLRAYDSISEALASIGQYLDFYNGRRPHSSLDGVTPDQAYFNPLPLRLAA
ncbi:integrase core domain-containing protein, partial [Bradyrhizobium liaoningense]|uniref:integrase core domain-containing protein n=1 Tax=Bradyrhizobium liaoningense TaxID=43992 RepID=UPI0020131E31